jgi:hypothetical protein
MSGLARDIKRALTLPPWVVAAKLARRARRERETAAARAADVSRLTYLRADEDARKVVRLLSFSAPPSPPSHLRDMARRYLDHEFDLLGSGWVRVEYGMTARGVEGHVYDSGPRVRADASGEWLASLVTAPNLPRARELWRLVDPGYTPIDWQLDFKSGFRWSARTWYRDIAYGELPGVDVKVPWEIARMQHLPQLALVAVDPTTDEGFANRCLRGIRNQILDFAATNPPRFGACWTCTMDVAIRIVNSLLAVDILAAGGSALDEPFMRAFERFTEEHARFITENLEDAADVLGNHYFADVCGWTIVAAYTGDEESLARAAREVLVQAELQFDERGANFEGSTSYHRLSGEMLVWALAALLRVGIDIPDAVARRVGGMPGFALVGVRPDDRAVQFGDTDSGRFVKPLPDVRGDGSLIEDPLRVGHLVAEVAGLTGDRALLASAPGHTVDAALIAALAGRTLDVPAPSPPVTGRGSLDEWFAIARAAPASCVTEYALPAGALEGLAVAGYPEFGAWFWRADGLFMAVRCGPVGQRGQGGHDHNDQLGVELWVGGEPLLIDPGTYLYTPLLERRNEYRSVAAHAAPRIPGREPGDLELGAFQIVDAAPGTCEAFGPEGFCGHHDGFDVRVHRVVELTEDAVRITDWREDGGSLESLPLSPAFSPGYGLRDEDGLR